MKKLVTMRDIANGLGVSVVTVSKALAGKDGVGDDLRQKILIRADELGYVSKSDKKNESVNKNIALIVAERFLTDNNSFYFKVYHKISMELSKKEFIGILEIVRAEDENRGRIPKVVQTETVDQVVIIGEMKMVFLENLSKVGISMIFFDFENEEFDVDSIIGDNVTGGYIMTRYLAQKGYTNIGYVGNYTVTRSILDRLMGHLKYKLAKNLPMPDYWIISDRDDEGKNINLKLPAEMPDAFFCNCDETAYRMIKTLEDAGYKVPEDIAVVGYDDYSSQIPEGIELTTYRVNIDEMVRQCVHIVTKRSLNANYRRGVMLVHGDLIERKTVLPRV